MLLISNAMRWSDWNCDGDEADDGDCLLMMSGGRDYPSNAADYAADSCVEEEDLSSY
jgi:hypothetical protein